MNYRKLTASGISLALTIAMFPFPVRTHAEELSEGVKHIVARSDFLYNMAWTCQKDVKGWRNQSANTFIEGRSYHIPYGQPDDIGGFLSFDTDFATFLAAAADAESEFYTQRSYSYENGGSYSVYYALDCSSAVSFCWDVAVRTETKDFPKLDVTSIGLCTSANVDKIEVGDAINKTYSHVVLVTDIRRNADGTVQYYEITEQTVPEMKRSLLTPAEMTAKYSKYTILRYNQRDSVAPPPEMEPTVQLTTTSGTSMTDTVFSWGTTLPDTDSYDLMIWSDAYSDTEPVLKETGMDVTEYSVSLTPGVYEASVGVTTTGSRTFRSWDMVFEVANAYGDTDGSGQIDTADAAMILEGISALGAGSTLLTDAQVTASDINTDGLLGTDDASALLQYIAVSGSGVDMTLEEYMQ